MSTIRSCYFKF